ncbi:MAG: universal stress protein [Armatimonadetes bacterium]|nr:universal stress protein [Armatimonadota bacterium]
MPDQRPTPEELLQRIQEEERRAKRGRLTILLGFAAGVGKTVRMLQEGRRLKAEGKDVVVGYFEPHGRKGTVEQLGDLEVIPRRKVEYRGTVLEEMDVDAILARGPQVVLVDELAHTNAPGSPREKRWQDVEVLLDAGVDVITTVNVQHIESLNDKIAQVTGVRVRETMPDRVLDEAHEVVIVDLTPEALRERLKRGEIYPPESVERALQNFFRSANLSALRELALLEVAEEADRDLEAYRREEAMAQAWGVQERILVCISSTRPSTLLVRRGARLARRVHGKCYALFVAPPGGLKSLPEEQREYVEADFQLARTLDCETACIESRDIARAVAEYARERQVTQIFLGRSRRTRWQERLQGSVINDVVRLAEGIDVHVVADR